MALAPDQNRASRKSALDGWYGARRFGALGLVSLAGWVLRTAIGLYQRQMISPSSVRVALSISGQLEKSALALLMGRKPIEPDKNAATAQRLGGEP